MGQTSIQRKLLIGLAVPVIVVALVTGSQVFRGAEAVGQDQP